MNHWRRLLAPLGWLMGSAVWVRNKLFDTGLRKQVHLPRPVISIGNLAMGGTGKSPVCNDLLGRLLNDGYQVTLLSRGYGRKDPERSFVVKPDTPWFLAGDEPLMLARNHSQATVCVGPSRLDAACAAPDLPDVYLIDDGFQHRQVARDLDVVLIDLQQGTPRFFPVKNFREELSALKRAHMVVLTRWRGEATDEWDAAIHSIAPNLGVLRAKFQPGCIRNLSDGTPWNAVDIQGKPVVAYTGIAHPDQFFQSLQDMGANLLYSLALRDHQPLTDSQRNDLRNAIQTHGAAFLITTEKDVVKLDKNHGFDIVVAYLTLDVIWDDPDTLNQHIQRLAKHKETP